MTLSPSEVVQVCSAEQSEIELICSTNETWLAWNFLLVNDPRSILTGQERYFSTLDLNPQPQQLEVGPVLLTFTRNSTQYSSPLISILSITVNGSTALLNMTEVNCTELTTMGEQLQEKSTTIHVISDIQTGA